MSKLFSELKRRNVLRVLALYLVSAWLIAQIADVVIGLANLPPVIGRTVLIILALGFPVAVVLAWVFEWTPEGIRREAAAGEESASCGSPGRRFDYVIISLLSVALVYFIATHDWGAIPEPAAASIAVLPFENRSAQADDLYFTDGVHDDVLTQLAKISSLVVISRTSVMRYRDSGKTIPEIAAELGVATILEGGVQRSGNRVRINLQLIDAATDKHLWAETYDKELSADNVFEIQSQIATSIAALLRARLLPGEQQRIETIPTHNLDAYDAYLIGRRYLAGRSHDGMIRAQEYFSRAIELDPEFALAYAGLADTLVILSTVESPDAAEQLAEAEHAARKALDLDPELAEAHTSMGLVRKFSGDAPGEYVSYFERGVELAPGSADARKWYANYLSESGRFNEALQQLQKAVVLDPMSAIVRVNLGQVLEALGKSVEADSAYRRALEIDPGFQPALFAVLEDLAADERLVLLSTAFAQNRDPLALLMFVLGYLEIGDDSRAEQWDAVLDRVAPGSPYLLVSRFNLSLYRGQQADALRLAAELLAFESPEMPVASRILLTHDLRTGNPQAALGRYEGKYPALLADEPKVAGDYPAAIDIATLLKALDDPAERADRLLEGSLAYLGTLSGKQNQRFAEARIFAVRADKEEALRRLGDAIRAGWSRQWWFVMKHDPALDSLRDDPRFQAMQDEIAARMADLLANVRELEASGEIALPH